MGRVRGQSAGRKRCQVPFFLEKVPDTFSPDTFSPYPCATQQESDTCDQDPNDDQWKQGHYDDNGEWQTTLISNKDGQLQDQSGNVYTANVTGAGVYFTQAGSSNAQMGVFQNGTTETDIAGTGALSGFQFQFTYSNIDKNQTAGGTFTYAGTADEAAAALENAGFTHRWLNLFDTFNPNHRSTDTYDAIDFRSPASRADGTGSGHMTVHSPVMTFDRWRIPIDTVPTSGDLHLGEHNPFSLNGLVGHIKEQ